MRCLGALAWRANSRALSLVAGGGGHGGSGGSPLSAAAAAAGDLTARYLWAT